MAAFQFLGDLSPVSAASPEHHVRRRKQLTCMKNCFVITANYLIKRAFFGKRRRCLSRKDRLTAVTQPLNIISMHHLLTSVLNKGGVRADKIGRDLNHAMLSGFRLLFMSE